MAATALLEEDKTELSARYAKIAQYYVMVS